jgi:hypothetical protein
MIVQIFYDDIKDKWDDVYESLSIALPKYEVELPGLKEALLKGLETKQAQLWVYKKDENVKAYMLTILTPNPVFRSDDLFIYALVSFEPLTDQDFNQGLLLLRKYAIQNGCGRVTAFSDIPQLLNACRKNGALVVNKIIFNI